MAPKSTLRGLWAASLTPLAADGSIDQKLLVDHARFLLRSGCDGIVPFGTTGEGQSFTLAERRLAVEALLGAGIKPDAMAVGIGCAAIGDAAELARHALGLGIRHLLALPPFFFKGVSDAGVAAAFARLIDMVGDARMQLVLYHIPQVTAVPVGFAAIEKLLRDYPAIVVAIKDSAGEWTHTQELLRRFPGLAVLVGAEDQLPQALRHGAAGTICGMANLVPALMRKVHDSAGKPEEAALTQRIAALAGIVDRGSFVARLKAALGEATGLPSWRAVRAPVMPLAAPDAQTLWQELRAAALTSADTGAAGTLPKGAAAAAP